MELVIIALAMTLTLMAWFWLRQSLRRRGVGVQPRPHEMWVLGQYSPLLTWVCYRLCSPTYWRTVWQGWQRQWPEMLRQLKPARIRWQPPPLPETEAPPTPIADDYGPLMAVLLASVLTYAAFGQYLLVWQPAQSERGWALTGIAVVLFGAVVWLRARGAVPTRLAAFSVKLGARPSQLLLLPPALALAAAAYELAGPRPKAVNPILALTTWGAALSLVVLAAQRRAAAAASSAAPWGRAEVLAVAGLGLLALLVRMVDNTTIPATWTGDEASAALIGVEFLRGQRDNVFALGWFSFPALYFIIPALAIGLGGNDYGALRTPSAIAGALTVVSLYWLARPIFGRLTAALAALLLATLSFHIHFSRIGLQNVWDGLFTVAALGAFWRGWQTGRRAWFIVAGLLLGLAQYFYVSSRLLPLVLLGWLVLAALFQRETLRQRLADVIWLAVVAVVVVLPLASFYVQHPQEFTAPINRVASTGDWFLQEANRLQQPVWRVLWNNVYAAALAFTGTPLRYWYNAGKPLLLEVSAPLFVMGVLWLSLKVRDPRAWLPGLWLAGVIAGGAFTDSTPAGQRYVVGAPVAVLVAAIGLSTLGRWAVEAWPAARWLVYAALGLIVAAAMARELYFYFKEYIPNLGRGDANTEVATVLAGYLADQPPGTTVYFFGPPRMSYYGFSTHPFLAPQVVGNDVFEPLTAPPTWRITGRTHFVFLQHREAERRLVETSYPNGVYRQFFDLKQRPLFVMYTIEGPP